MIRVRVEANGRAIAHATIVNTSQLADVSDYQATVVEWGSETLGIETLSAAYDIKDHPRQQSVWALVAKAAEEAARRAAAGRAPRCPEEEDP